MEEAIRQVVQGVVMKAPMGTDARTIRAGLFGFVVLLVCILIQCPRTLAVTVPQLRQLKIMPDEESRWYKGAHCFRV